MDRGSRYCGNKTGQNVSVTGDEVKILFYSDRETEQRGYLLNFSLISHGKWDHNETDKTYKVYQVYLPLKFWSSTYFHFIPQTLLKLPASPRYIYVICQLGGPYSEKL